MLLLWLVVLFVAFCCCSYFFRVFPLFSVPKKTQISFPVCHIGHRGGGGDFPENSLAAFRSGWLHHEVDVLELDVRYTKDKVLVIMHDPHFSRISGVQKKVCDMTYEELPSIGGKERVCKLEDLLDDPDLRDAPICLDFKVHNNEGIIKETYEMFEKRGRLGKLVWGSFSEETRKMCVKLYPNVPTFFSLTKTVQLYLFFIFGLLPFLPISNESHGVMLCSVLLKKEWFDKLMEKDGKGAISLFFLRAFNLILGFRFFVYACEHPSFVRHLITRGIRVCFWTVNDDEDLQRVKRSGKYVKEITSFSFYFFF